MSTKEFSDTIATLILNGFHVSTVDRLSPTNIIVNCYRLDKLGAIARYSILFSDDPLESASCELLIKIATDREHSKPLLVSERYSTKACDSYSTAEFFDFFGGVVNTGLVLIPGLPGILQKLGLNELPAGLSGKPNDLHELYVKECLQFVMDSPARRYGSDRLFQKLPDAIVLGRDQLLLPLDSKSYSGGYSISSDDINRYAFYVNDFNKRYSGYVGKAFAFVIVTGTISDSEQSIQNRSQELYIQCGATICCLDSQTLGEFVELLINEPWIKSAIDWRKLFVKVKLTLSDFRQEVARVKKDKIV